MSAPPDIAFDYDTRFVEVDLRGDLDRWSRAAAETAWERTGQKAGRRELRRLAENLRVLAEHSLRQNPMGALALVPEPWVGVTGMVQVIPVDLGDEPFDQLLADLALPEEELARPAERGSVETAAGSATTLLQHILRAGDAVTENLQFVWHFPAQRAAVVLGIAFNDLIEAARWRPAIYELARGISLGDTAHDTAHDPAPG